MKKICISKVANGPKELESVMWSIIRTVSSVMCEKYLRPVLQGE